MVAIWSVTASTQLVAPTRDLNAIDTIFLWRRVTAEILSIRLLFLSSVYNSRISRILQGTVVFSWFAWKQTKDSRRGKQSIDREWLSSKKTSKCSGAFTFSRCIYKGAIHFHSRLVGSGCYARVRLPLRATRYTSRRKSRTSRKCEQLCLSFASRSRRRPAKMTTLGPGTTIRRRRASRSARPGALSVYDI